MLTLDTLNVMLAVSEEGLIEEMIIALLASPQLAVFFEKFPRLKAAITDDVPRWREALRSRLKDARKRKIFLYLYLSTMAFMAESFFSISATSLNCVRHRSRL